MNRNWVERDFYAELGIGMNASTNEIKAAYHRLARQHHPDSNRGSSQAEAKFKRIAEAYSVLSKPDKRSEYDQVRRFIEEHRSDGRQGEDYSDENDRTQYDQSQSSTAEDRSSYIYRPDPAPRFWDNPLIFVDHKSDSGGCSGCLWPWVGCLFALIWGLSRYFLVLLVLFAIAAVIGTIVSLVGG